MKCSTENCTNETAPNRTICWKCHSRQFRENNPLRYLFNTLKFNAKRRGKSFDLTLEQFSEFCTKTNYDKLKGKTALSLTVDRREPNKGYTYSNIRAITLSDNTKRHFDPTHEPEKNCPF